MCLCFAQFRFGFRKLKADKKFLMETKKFLMLFNGKKNIIPQKH